MRTFSNYSLAEHCSYVIQTFHCCPTTIFKRFKSPFTHVIETKINCVTVKKQLIEHTYYNMYKSSPLPLSLPPSLPPSLLPPSLPPTLPPSLPPSLTLNALLYAFFHCCAHGSGVQMCGLYCQRPKRHGC